MWNSISNKLLTAGIRRYIPTAAPFKPVMYASELADRPNLENDDENDEDVLELWTDDWDG